MAEKRQNFASILLQTEGKNVRLEFFDAEDWPNRPESREGLFRVRHNGRWVKTRGKFSFLTPKAVAAYLVDVVHATMQWKGARSMCAPAKALRCGTPVTHIDVDGKTERLFVMTEPLHGYDGRWYVFVSKGMCRQIRPEPVPVENLKIREG